MTLPSCTIASVGRSISYSPIRLAAASIMSRTLSSSVARDWMSSRSIGVMNVLFNSSKTRWTVSSPRCSMSLIRRHFIGTSRKSCSNPSSAIAASSTVSESLSRRSKNCRSCGIIHPFNPMAPRPSKRGCLETTLRCRTEAVRLRITDVHARGLQLREELLPHLPVPGKALDRLPGHLVVPEQLLHVPGRDPGPAGDSLDAGRLDDLWVRHLRIGHRVHDDLEPP